MTLKTRSVPNFLICDILGLPARDFSDSVINKSRSCVGQRLVILKRDPCVQSASMGNFGTEYQAPFFPINPAMFLTGTKFRR
jgi:hypothetical protein